MLSYNFKFNVLILIGVTLNYDALEANYWNSQIERVEQLRLKISNLPSVTDGRTVPDDDSLSLGRGRRLSMAIMFIDICDFSSRQLESAEEQNLMLNVLNLFFTEMIRICEDYGGNVEKNTGDGLMVYFNDNEGTPAENGAKRAVSCALTMLATNTHLISPILKASNVEPIDFRISIDHGNVTVAKIGAPRKFSANTAIGTTANFASKMLKMAGKNEIVIGETVKVLLPTYWQSNFTIATPEPSGWYYRANNTQYMLYKYFGRWEKLL